jgi:hypothetical protein
MTVKAYGNRYAVQPLAKYRKAFGNLIGISLCKLQNRNRMNMVQRIRINDLDGWKIPIARISRKRYEGPVYNLGVRAQNSYLLNGIAVHNCIRAKEEAKARIFMDTTFELGHIGTPIIVDSRLHEEHNDPVQMERIYGPYKRYGVYDVAHFPQAEEAVKKNGNLEPEVLAL